MVVIVDLVYDNVTWIKPARAILTTLCFDDNYEIHPTYWILFLSRRFFP